MKISFLWVFLSIKLFISSFICNAQDFDLKSDTSDIEIDGSLKDWGDKLSLNKKTNISYAIRNDKQNLYWVIATRDSVLQSSILGAGISFSLNTKGNKSKDYEITFPLSGKEDPSEFMNLDSLQTRLKVILSKYRKIGVRGFTAIEDEELGSSNLYGIKIAIGYDKGYLIYEESIPLSLFGDIDKLNKTWAFNIKINGLERKVEKVSGGELIANIYSKKSSLSNRRITQAEINNTGMVLGRELGVAPILNLTIPVDFWGEFVLEK